MINQIMANGQAGLMDLNLLQQQKVLSAGAFDYILKDYSAHIFYANAREGQSLEDVRDLLLEQLEKLKNGEFEDWLLQAVIKNMKWSRMKTYERNRGRAFAMVNAFILDQKWEDYLKEIEVIGKITKQDIIDFANEKYGENYVICYKRMGEAKNRHKMEKPTITPLTIDRSKESNWSKDFSKSKSDRLTPKFVNYNEDIYELRGIFFNEDLVFNYVQNNDNQTFNLYYVFDMGTNHDKELALAIKYLPYLGTTQHSAEELKKEFYKLGVKFRVSASANQIYVSLYGLEESLEEAVTLFEQVLKDVEPDAKALENLTADILKKRANDKLDKRKILWSGMYDFARYDGLNPFTNILSESELKALKAEDLIQKIKGLNQYKHQIFYYGQKQVTEVIPILQKHHKTPEILIDYPAPVTFKERNTTEDQVFFVDYDQVQTEIIMIAKDESFNKELMPYARFFGEYFGSGLSSIMFQEIRESKGLAYSAFANFAVPRYKDKSHFSWAYVGTQADKMKDAIGAMRGLMNEMPMAERQFEASRNAVLKKIESERITRTSLFFNRENNKYRGLDYDVRKDIYLKVHTLKPEELQKFFAEHIKGKPYTFMVLGKKDAVDLEFLKSIGNFQELTLEELFNY